MDEKVTSEVDIDALALLTPEEAGVVLRLKPERVRRLIRTGRLPGYRPGGGNVRIRRSDLAHYILEGALAH